MLKRIIKVLVKGCLYVVFTPWRLLRHKHDGVLPKEERHEMPNDILLGMVREAIREGHTATIWVKGYSMRPFLEHMRDKVILAQPERPYAVGDAVLAEIAKGHYVLHRIIQLDGDCVTLMGDGNLKGTEHCKVADIAGIVTDYIRPKRTIKADDEQLIRRIKRWRRWLPYRRYLLLLYKASL